MLPSSENCREIHRRNTISGLSNVKSPGTLRSSISNRRFARKHIFLDSEFRRANLGDSVDSGKKDGAQGYLFWHSSKDICSAHFVKILTPGHLGQITRAQQMLFMLGHLAWSGGLTWGDLRSQNFHKMCGINTIKAILKKRWPCAPPFFRYQ